MIKSIKRKIRNNGYKETFREVASVLWSYYRVNSILRLIDLNEFERLNRQYNKKSVGGVGRKKYLAIKPWMTKNLRYIYMLGLNEGLCPLNILDIGTGFGYFPFLCCHFGHNAIGMDLDDRAMYNEVIQIFGVERKTWKVKAYQPLPEFGIKFDLITAFMICFDDYGKGTKKWGVDEWTFFLNDLKTYRMRDNGRIFFQFNKPIADFDKKLYHFFLKKGAVIDLGRVYFQSLYRL